MHFGDENRNSIYSVSAELITVCAPTCEAIKVSYVANEQTDELRQPYLMQ